MNISIMLVAIVLLKIGPTLNAVFPLSKNFGSFERISCTTYEGSKASAIQCRIKNIDRYNLKGFISINVTEPVTGLWLHADVYYKYTTYQKLAVELSEDLCGWIDNKRNSFFLDYLKPLILKYSNFNHSCPYSGFIYGKADNISVQEFAFPQIIPAGRYRVDVNVTEGARKKLFFGSSVYFAISDHRVEIV